MEQSLADDDDEFSALVGDLEMALGWNHTEVRVACLAQALCWCGTLNDASNDYDEFGKLPDKLKRGDHDQRRDKRKRLVRAQLLLGTPLFILGKFIGWFIES